MTKKYLSGRVERTSPTDLTTDRYEYIGLEQTEPNLGDPLVGPSSIGAKGIPPGQQYIIATTGIPGERYWIRKEGGIIPGTITVYNENTSTGLVGGSSSTTQLVFIGNAINVTAPYAGPPYPPDVYIKISPPGNNGDVLFKDLDDFETSSKLVFNSSVGILTIGNGLNVGSGGTIFTIKPTGLVGIGTSSPTQELHIQGDLRLTGTVYDYNDQPGITGDVLIKNNFGGLIWVNQLSLRTGAGGTYRNIQYHNSAGLVDGAATFVFDEFNNRVGVGSTQPKVTFDVLGISSFTGSTTIDNLKVGVATIGTLGVTGLTTTKDLDVTGIATITTLGVSGLATTRNLQVIGVATISTLGVTGLTTTRNLEVIGVSTFNDKVNILGDLGVTGLTTTKNLNVTGVATIGTLGVTGLTTTKDLIVTGIATVGNIKIDTNTVSTTTGNLILDSNLGTTKINDILFINDATQSTTKDNGSIYTEGGVGIELNLNVGGAVSFAGITTLASAGGITTTGGDLYVGGNLYTTEDFYLDEIFARYGKFTEDLIVLRNVGIGTDNPLQKFQIGVANTLGHSNDGKVFVVTSSADVGIGTTNPLAKLDVRGAITGVTVIKASDNTTNITLTSGTLTAFAGDIKVGGNVIQASTGATSITLSGEDVTVAGDLTVTGNDIKSSSATAITLTGANVSIGGTLTVTGNDIKSSSETAITLSGANVTAKGNLTVEGNTTLGTDINSDTVSFAATVSSHIIPSTNDLYELGSTDIRWKDIYATTFNGQFVGNADTATRVGVGTTTGNGSYYLTFVGSNNATRANEYLYSDDGISYTPSTDLLTVGKIKPTQIQDSSSGTGTENYVLTANGSGGWTWSNVIITAITDATAAAAASAQQAAGSATTAGQSATAAGQSATAAGQSAGQAAGSATTAGQSATTAGQSATAAGQSATTAGQSAINAADSAGEASGSAADAVTSAADAVTSAQQAAGSATAAGQSAGQAAGSATTAGQSATAAGQSATNAADSAGEASGSAADAVTSAADAVTSAQQAAGAAQQAAGYQDQADVSAGAAGTSAQQAAGSATTAGQSATTAGTSAQQAAGSATTAGQSAGQAAGSATAAGQSAGQAATAGAAAGTAAINSVAAANQVLYKNSENTLVVGSDNLTFDGTSVKTLGQLYINNASPTIYLQDSNHRSSMIHCNSNYFYILRCDGNNSTTSEAFNQQWPLYINLETNDAVFGGSIYAVGNVTAYYSDERLKENITTIPSALTKLLTLRGVTFNSNKLAEQYGYVDKKEQVGVIAQDIEKVLPQIVVLAPFDVLTDKGGNKYSKSGENYKTVDYPKLIPLLIEAIKEQQEIIVDLQSRLEILEGK